MDSLDKAVRLHLAGDIAEDVDQGEVARQGGGNHNGTDVDPDRLCRFGLGQNIAVLDRLSLPRRREQEAVEATLEPPRSIPAGEDLMAGSPEDLGGLEPEQPLGRIVPEDDPLGLVRGEDAIGRAGQALCQGLKVSGFHLRLLRKSLDAAGAKSRK